ncbi:MAG: type I-C CRISPR-associated protein Cas8c/Csd1 [Oscillospiraceae bacterium]|nr:type I-C CRISPR-associated protein Cas8c/Csd1 [Oscillospiraceae bacterium]
MGWTDELYQVYELACKDPENGLLPVSHSTANAQIELTIDEKGNFKGASIVNKEDAVTIIPVTEGSGARTSGVCAMPFADKLVYMCGDYTRYVEGKHSDNSTFFSAYMDQLACWKESDYTHPAIVALYEYLQKKTLMEDLVKSGVLKTDPDTGMLQTKVKINGIDQEDAFVRIVVRYKELDKEPRTWLDPSLYESFIHFNSSMMGNEQLCYATGEISPVTYKHPKKIRNSGDSAKLISSNDESGFTYRGRFSDKEEALSVSYEFSQKMHNALKWLIAKQGCSFGSLTLVIWASALAHIPDELSGSAEDDWEDDEYYDSLEGYRSWLRKYIFGYEQRFRNDTKVMIMGLDSASPGRLSVAVYDELQGSDFLHHLQNWHECSAWIRYDSKRKRPVVKSFVLREIVRAAYGTEQNGMLKCDDKLTREQILRLLPCVMNGRALPQDIMQMLYHKASAPLKYEQKYLHSTVLDTACGMYRAYRKGAIPMAYDPNETDRSYLYGCLLAIADKAESDTYEEGDRSKRVTNARRYWSNFAQHPCHTWQIIEERLRPYLDRHKYRSSVEKDIQTVMDRFIPIEFADNSRLSPMYLIGYHHYMSYMYNRNKEEN